MDISRRQLLRIAGAGIGAASLGGARTLSAQVPEESNTEALAIMRKGIDKALEVINIDLLEAEARRVYTDAVYAFVANGAGRNWTLRENQRAWDDWSLNAHRMGGSCAREGSSDEYVRHNEARPWLPYGTFKAGSANAFKTNLTWKDTEMIQKVTGLPVVVKGVTRPEDAVAAIAAGAAAIQVSNHGGRALDGTPASITVLPAIADAVKGRVPIILDSGIRRGTDVVKSLALGANAVAIGRPVMYALVLGGASGVDSVIRFIHNELVDTMLHCGAGRLADLNRSHIARARETMTS
jgi:isopentenyl diphosphate isomerase/L-lactate dehydrogenase-like FMN-dependent dehydrogenase